jgi:hypothetical protein
MADASRPIWRAVSSISAPHNLAHESIILQRDLVQLLPV